MEGQVNVIGKGLNTPNKLAAALPHLWAPYAFLPAQLVHSLHQASFCIRHMIWPCPSQPGQAELQQCRPQSPPKGDQVPGNDDPGHATRLVATQQPDVHTPRAEITPIQLQG